MHLVGLFLGRLEPGAPKLIDSLEGSDRDLVEKFIGEQDVWKEEITEGVGASELLAQYRLLQTLDLLSLILCLNMPDQPSSTTLRNVPHSAPGTSLAIIEVATNSEQVTLDPYPLSSAMVEVSVQGRVLESPTFDDLETYRGALTNAPAEDLNFTLSAA